MPLIMSLKYLMLFMSPSVRFDVGRRIFNAFNLFDAFPCGIIVPMKLTDLRTPAFLIDLPGLKRNTSRMLERAKEHGVRLRPHVKTHKTVEIARMQTGSENGGITVSTLAEARAFLRAGFRDITYAFPVTPNKIDETAELMRDADDFHLLVDHSNTLEALISFARAKGVRFSMFLKVDSGLHRAGVDPKSYSSVGMARRMHFEEGILFQGILTHGGHAYLCRDRGEIREAAEGERATMARFAGLLRDEGIPCPIVSAGSTPTAVCGTSWEGVDELRPGNYVFFDKSQADIGTCGPDECAASVLATVAGHYPVRNQLLIDAGALALSKDRGAVHVGEEITFGAVLGHPNFKIASLSQEHGIIECRERIDYETFPVGSLLRIIPNHSCLSATLFSKFHVVEGDEVVDEWIPVRGW